MNFLYLPVMKIFPLTSRLQHLELQSYGRNMNPNCEPRKVACGSLKDAITVRNIYFKYSDYRKGV
jgi:hypothetical protein